MHRKWFSVFLLHLFGVLTVTLVESNAENQRNGVSDSNNTFIDSFSTINRIASEYHDRSRRAVVQALRLIDEKHCPEIRNLCSNLRDGSDDLPVLECVQTFLSNQIESLSDECQHTIWTHTSKVYHFSIERLEMLKSIR